MSTTRRAFLQRLGAAGLVTLGATPPTVLSRAVWAAGNASTADSGRVLVIIELAGGNDGLNTVIPYTEDEYYKCRPSLAIPKDQVLKIDDSVGLNPQLSGLQRLFDAGAGCCLQGVGYPNPDRSHFRSMDIWHSAVTDREYTRDGWLGRAFDQSIAQLAGRMPALALGVERIPLALVSNRVSIPAIRDVGSFKLKSGPGPSANQSRVKSTLKEIVSKSPGEIESDLDFLRFTARTSLDMVDRLQAAQETGSSAVYPDSGLAHRLKTIANLVAGEFGAQIYYTTLGGFDTHARQKPAHDGLMRELGDGVAAFHADLASRQIADRVMTITFSEFGRRVEENGSLGTDHGAASQMFAFGPVAKPGVVGPHPSLTDLLEGDLKFHTDFRGVYATLLERWLKFPVAGVLEGDFPRLDFV